MKTCSHAGHKLLQLLSYASSEDEEDEDECKSHIYLYFIRHVMFSSNFLHAVIFLPVLHL